VQRGGAFLVREGEWVYLDIPGRPRDRPQRSRVLTVRLERVDMTGRADDARQQRGVGSPPRPDVK
jgi:hypothetical protein